MADARGRLAFTNEARAEGFVRREVRVQDLDRDALLQGHVHAFVHARHAAAPDDTPEPIRAERRAGHQPRIELELRIGFWLCEGHGTSTSICARKVRPS